MFYEPCLQCVLFLDFDYLKFYCSSLNYYTTAMMSPPNELETFCYGAVDQLNEGFGKFPCVFCNLCI